MAEASFGWPRGSRFAVIYREGMGLGGVPGRGGEFRRRGRGPGLPAAANSSRTLAGVVYSDDESRRPGSANWRG
jgi:hypothetical protein